MTLLSTAVASLARLALARPELPAPGLHRWGLGWSDRLPGHLPARTLALVKSGSRPPLADAGTAAGPLRKPALLLACVPARWALVTQLRARLRPVGGSAGSLDALAWKDAELRPRQRVHETLATISC